MPSIIPPEGATVPFDRERLERSLARRGLDPLLANEVAGRVARLVAEHPGEAIPLDHLHPLIGEALLDMGREATLSARAPTSEFRVTPPAHAPSASERQAVLPATSTPHGPGLDPWWALRRLGLQTAPDGLAFVAPGAVRTVYANDTATTRTISMRVAYSGRAILQLPGGRRAKLEGLGREVRDVEVPSGAVLCVEGELTPYSAVAWWIA